MREASGKDRGQGSAYNDVRMNLLTYALTMLFDRSLDEVLRERVMRPLGAVETWSWLGYPTSVVTTVSGNFTWSVAVRTGLAGCSSRPVA